MKLSKLDAAIAEAHRFLARAKALKAAEIPTDPVSKLAGHDRWIGNSPRESGAVRRASMDLTRALADLRRRTS